MRFQVLIFLLAFIMSTVAQGEPQKAIVVSYPPETPDSVVSSAKKAIEKAGGVITHEYNLIKGFAATAPVKALEAVRALGEQWPPVIEEDQVVTILPNSNSA